MTIEFECEGLRIESEMNKREHWSVRRKRFDSQAREVLFSWPRNGCCDVLLPPRRACKRCVSKALPLVVTLTRIGPRTLDSDNLAGGFKAVRDQVARMLWLDDGDPRIEWKYKQERGRPKFYGIRVRIESRQR